MALTPCGTRRSQTRATVACNETRRQQTTNFRDGAVTVRGTGIAFTGSQTITDSGNGLAVFPVGTIVRTRLTTLNNRAFEVSGSAAGTLNISNPTTIAESAGATFELRRVG